MKGGLESLYTVSIIDLLHQIFKGGHEQGWGGITISSLYFSPKINKCHPALPVLFRQIRV